MSKKPSNPKEKQLFYSPDGTTIRVTHPDGAVALVDGDPRELPQKLWRLATRAGCLIKGGITADQLKGPNVDESADAFKRRELIKQAMFDAARSEENAQGFEDAFTAAGIPNVRWLEKRVGFGIDADERDQIWAEAEVELDEEEEQDDDENENDGKSKQESDD